MWKRTCISPQLTFKNYTNPRFPPRSAKRNANFGILDSATASGLLPLGQHDDGRDDSQANKASPPHKATAREAKGIQTRDAPTHGNRGPSKHEECLPRGTPIHTALKKE